MKKLEAYLGREHGTPAPGDRVSIDTPLAISQRELNETKCWEYIRQHDGVNWDLFGYVKAVRLPSGELLIIDGQHRMYIIKRILPHCTEVPAHIVDGTSELAARYFDALNGGSSKNLTTEEKFWAKLCAGDEFAQMIANCVAKTEYSLGKFQQSEDRVGLKYANTLKAIRMGESYFQKSCEITHELWPGRGGCDNFISGQTRLFQIYPELANPELKIHEHYVEWLRVLRDGLNVNPSNLQFKKYRNNGPWYDAVAYGLARKFFQMIRGRGWNAPPLSKIETIWMEGNKSEDDADLESII